MADNYDNNDKLSLHVTSKNITNLSSGFVDVAIQGQASMRLSGPIGGGGVGSKPIVTAPQNPRTGCTEIGFATSGTVTADNVDWVFGNF